MRFFSAVLILLTMTSFLFASDYFYIKKYSVNIVLNPDTTFDVEERIYVVFTMPQSTITKKIRYSGQSREVLYRNIRVLDDEYKIEKEQDSMLIRISAGGTNFETEKLFVIRYRVLEAMTTASNESECEFFWDFIDTDWDTFIENVTFQVTLPKPVSGKLLNYGVYFGDYNLSNRTSMTTYDGQSLNGVITTQIPQKQAVTFRLTMPRNLFDIAALNTARYADCYYISNFAQSVEVDRSGVLSVDEQFIVKFLKDTNQIALERPSVSEKQPDANPFLAAGFSPSNYINLIFNESYSAPIRIVDTKKEQKVYLLIEGTSNRSVLVRRHYNVYGLIQNLKNTSTLEWKIAPFAGKEPVNNLKARLKLPSDMSDGAIELQLQTDDWRYYIWPETVSRILNHSEWTMEAPSGILPGYLIRYTVRFPDNYFGHWNPLPILGLWFVNEPLLFLPFIALLIGAVLWYLFSRDNVVQKELIAYPPENVSPAECGVLMDNISDTHLYTIVYDWAVSGYIRIEKIPSGDFVDFIFHKLKELPWNARDFEKTLFEGMFPEQTHSRVLSTLTHFYKPILEQSRKQLMQYIAKKEIYKPFTRGIGIAFFVLGAICGVAFIWFIVQLAAYQTIAELISMLLTSVACFFYWKIIPNRTAKELPEYRNLLGFYYFMNQSDRDKLQELLDGDPQYFNKTLPYAIAMGIAELWVKRFGGLLMEPFQWYSAYDDGEFTARYLILTIEQSLWAMDQAFNAESY